VSTYLVVRCHARMRKLIRPEEMKRLLRSESLEELVEGLSRTEYRLLLKDLKHVDVDVLYRLYTDVFRSRLEWLYRNSPERFKDFLAEYCRRFEIENIMQVLRRKVTGSPVDIGRLVRLSFLPMDYKALSEAPGVSECLELLGKTPTYRKASVESRELYERYGTLLPVEAVLKKLYYTSVSKALSLLPRQDRKLVGEVLAVSVDIENCFTSVASLLYGYSPPLVREMLIRGLGKISSTVFLRVVDASSTSEVLELLAPYRDVVEAILEGREEVAYVRSRRMIRDLLLSRSVERTMDLSYALMYMELFEDEWRDLCFVTYAVGYNIPREDAVNCLICA